MDGIDENSSSTYQEKQQLESFFSNISLSQTIEDDDLQGMSSKRSVYWQLFAENRLAVITICYCYASFGMSVAILGPVLLDLSCLTATNLRTISWLFFFQTFLLSAGSAATGYLISKQVVPDEIILLVSMCLLPTTMILLPVGSSISALAANLSVMGLVLGCIENFCNIKMIDLFKDKVAPFLQTLHCCYGIGAFLSPFIAKPFLSNQNCTSFVGNETVEFPIANAMTNVSKNAYSLEHARENIHVQWAFMILAIIMLPGIGFVLAYGIQMDRWQLGRFELVLIQIFGIKTMTRRKGENAKDKMKRWSVHNTAFDPENSSDQNNSHSISKEMRQPSLFSFAYSAKGKLALNITLLAGVICLTYDGLQAIFADFGFTYAVSTVKYLAERRSEAAYTESVFWGSFAAGRLLSIFLATYFFPAAMIGTQMVVLIVVLTFLLIKSISSISLLLFYFFILGICVSSVVPSSLSLAAQFVELTPTLTTGLVIGASIGEMLFPVLVGTFIDAYGPRSFVGFSLLVAIVAAAVFFKLLSYGKTTSKFMTSGQTSMIFWNFESPATGEDATLMSNSQEGAGYYRRLSGEYDNEY